MVLVKDDGMKKDDRIFFFKDLIILVRIVIKSYGLWKGVYLIL